MNRQLTTRTDVEAEVTEALGKHAGDFDVESIIDAAYEYSAELDRFVSLVNADGFWAIVEEHAL